MDDVGALWRRSCQKKGWLRILPTMFPTGIWLQVEESVLQACVREVTMMLTLPIGCMDCNYNSDLESWVILNV